MKRKPTLAELEAKYLQQLSKASPSLAVLRKLRDDIVKLKWELGLQ